MRLHRRAHRTGCPCRLKTAVCLAIFSLASATSADDYFQRALDRIEESLVQPVEDYGLTVTDVFHNQTTSSLAKLGPIKEKWGLYTQAGKVHYRIERFDPRASSSPPYFVHVCVSQGGHGDTRSAVSARGKTTLSINLKPQTCGIGQVDAYNRYATEEDNLDRPDKQPFQILANPCFAPLEITPVELRQLPVTALPDEDGSRVYEVARQENDDQVIYRFYFSPSHGDALQRSDVGIVRGDRQGFLAQTVRRIEAWQALPGGGEVPERFTLNREENGKTVLTLDRTISRPMIADVDPSLFETGKLPEFQVDFHQVQDPAEVLRTGKPAQSRPTAQDDKQKRERFRLVLINFLVVGAMALVLLYKRRK
jgi:hypothetical protein